MLNGYPNRANGFVPPNASRVRKYVALLSHDGSANPPTTERVLENTLGVDVVWTRQGVGSYLTTLDTILPDEAVVCHVNLSGGLALKQAILYVGALNTVTLEILDLVAQDFAELNTSGSHISIEFLVYPIVD